jgi:signal transduction histidine kinase
MSIADPAGLLAHERAALDQAALRRIATLVAEGAPVAELFRALSQEVVKVLGVRAVTIDRYDHDQTTTTIGALNAGALQVGGRWPIEPGSLAALVLETGRPARLDDYSHLSGPRATAIKASGFSSAVAAPVMVDGVVWGMLWVAADGSEPLAAGIESRLPDFSELIAVAVSNGEARDRLRRLAEQEASLRRVATLVAQGATPGELFTAVTEELARILNVLSVSLVRFEPDETSVVLASFNDASFAVGSRWAHDASSLNAMVLETRAPSRIDDYAAVDGDIAEAARATGVQSGIAAPIVVDGQVWGMVAVGRRQHREELPDYAGTYTSRMMFSTESPEDIEARLAAFTELVATAIANTKSRAEVEQLAEEQAALSRVATLIAKEDPPETVFAKVAEETGRLLGGVECTLVQANDDGSATSVGSWGDSILAVFPVGTRFVPDSEGDGVAAVVLRTGKPFRIDDYAAVADPVARGALDRGIESAVGSPIVVGGTLWGAIFVTGTERFPPDTELQLARFTDLTATAVSNAAARSELIASRARIVTAGDEERRRIERNLHDGIQQRLLALGLDIQAVQARIPRDDEGTREGIGAIVHEIESVLEDVRVLSQGLHPALLSRAGLGPSLKALARRSPIPVEVNVALAERPPAPIETAVYYVISEAIANAIKHSEASMISVAVAGEAEGLRASVADDGVGGARLGAGSGLIGLADRIDALGGRLTLESPVSGGTKLSVELPLGA